MNKEDGARYSEALSFAALMHKNQQRRNGVPYIIHPINVSLRLQKNGFDVRYQIVGLFHDLLEDTEACEEEIRNYCDEEMLDAIWLLTKREGLSKEDYIGNILKNPIAKAVKNADRIDNLTDMKELDDMKFIKRYLKDTRESYYGLFSEELDDLYDCIKSKL